LPGFGPHLGAEFLVVTGGDLASFATPGRLAAYAGLVPTPRDSGRVVGNLRRPKRYNPRLRRVSIWPHYPASGPTAPPGRSSTPQTRRATHPYPGAPSPGPSPRRRALGTAAWRPRIRPAQTDARHRGGL